jgi:hypothetical protein
MVVVPLFSPQALIGIGSSIPSAERASARRCPSLACPPGLAIVIYGRTIGVGNGKVHAKILFGKHRGTII